MSGLTIALALLLLQDPQCRGVAADHLNAGYASARAFDLQAAAARFAAAVDAGCPEAAVAAAYIRGLDAARTAYAAGGSPASLQPVREAIALLEARGGSVPGRAQIAMFVLRAAAAAAQSERAEMGLLLAHAVDLERLQLDANQPGAPALTAHEVAGDLWLQVHRYEEAREAYRRAADRLGPTPRVLLGLARVAARLKDMSGACEQYGELLEWWRDRPADPGRAGAADPPEIREARAFDRESCAPPA